MRKPHILQDPALQSLSFLCHLSAKSTEEKERRRKEKQSKKQILVLSGPLEPNLIKYGFFFIAYLHQEHNY